MPQNANEKQTALNYIKRFFAPDAGFLKDVSNYKKADAALAFLLFLIMGAMYAALGAAQRESAFINGNITLAGCFFNMSLVFITAALVKLRGESLASVGLYGGKWRLSLIIGAVLAIILFFNNCILQLIIGKSLAALSAFKLITAVIYYFTVALCEEVVFRGFILTRLHGICKSTLICAFIAGVLFVAMHFPYRMAYGYTFVYLLQNTAWLLDLFITHLILSFICIKTNSLYGSILPHWVSNLANSLILH